MNNCVMTRLGECSYKETGCSDCKIISLCKEALEKQTPKKPDRITRHRGLCVNCSNTVFSHNNYCDTCGQLLDWKEVK